MGWFGFGKREAPPAQGAAVGGIESTPPATASTPLGGPELTAPTAVPNVGETLVPTVGRTEESKTWGNLTTARTESVVGAAETAPVGSTGGVPAPVSEVETGHNVVAAGTIENASPVIASDSEAIPAAEVQPPTTPIPPVENMTAGTSSTTPVAEETPAANLDTVKEEAASGTVSDTGLEPLASTSSEPPAVVEPVVATTEPVTPVVEETPVEETAAVAPAEGLETPHAEPVNTTSPAPAEGGTTTPEITTEEPNTEDATPANNITPFPGTSLDERPVAEDPNAAVTAPDGTTPETHTDQPEEQPAEPQAA